MTFRPRHFRRRKEPKFEIERMMEEVGQHYRDAPYGQNPYRNAATIKRSTINLRKKTSDRISGYF